jgi:CheY-like chemotaxis protein
MSAPLDVVRLDAVLRDNPLSRAAFVAEFRRSTDVDVEQLLVAAGTGELARVETLAHRIEGMAMVIGAKPLAAACGAIAARVQSGSAAGLGPALDALVECKRALYVCLDGPGPIDPGPASAQLDPGGNICAGLVFMVVEDHEFQRGVIMRLLRQQGALQVHGFADGASALVGARELREPCIFVLDLSMPELNGMEVMRIAAQEKLPVSVIMNSALGADMLRWPLDTAKSYGADVLGAISKPLTVAKLAPLLAHYRHTARPVPPAIPATQ